METTQMYALCILLPDDFMQELVLQDSDSQMNSYLDDNSAAAG
jgi:hypothetical protein